MPYIKQEDRALLEHLVKEMRLTGIKNAGELNYLITQLIHSFLDQGVHCYQRMNDIMGALEGAKLEMYRRRISIYEDAKKGDNGDVP